MFGIKNEICSICASSIELVKRTPLHCRILEKIDYTIFSMMLHDFEYIAIDVYH